jgi:Domain of unknown function (DUF222)
VSPTSAGPAGKEPLPEPADLRPGGAATSVAAGMGICWAGDIAMEEVLAAGDRLRRTRAGQDLPAWGEPERPAKGTAPRLAKSRTAAERPADDPPAGDPPAGDPPAGDPGVRGPAVRVPADEDPGNDDLLADDELRAAEAALCPSMSASEIAGHARMLPGPALAAWLGQARPGQMDEAGLVNSITGWRKLTSWAQAQELAAVGELGRRRGVMDDPEMDRDPARQLSAEFAPNEVAIALTLTQCAAEWWMNLAVSMSRRLPATWSALSEGTIDLARAKLIDMWTSPLDDDLARAVERKVLVRAGQQTTGQLRASLQRAVISADPAAAERRRAEAEKKARVELSGEDSGTAALSGHFLPAAQASAAWTRISALAEAMKGNGAGGGIDLLRAQVFIGLLLGTSPQPPDQASPGPTGPPGASPDGGDTRGGTNVPGGPHGADESSAPRDEDPGSSLDEDPGSSGGEDPGSGPHGEDQGSPPGEDPSDPSGHVPPSGNPGDDYPPPDGGGGGSGHPPGGPDDQPWCWPPIPAPDEIPWPGTGTGTRKFRRPELSVPWRTLAAWWDEPGQLTRMGAITAGVAREMARAAAADPTCVWRVVVTDARGQVMAVTQARWPGQTHRKSDHPPRPGVVGRITVTVPVMLLGQPPPAALAEWNANPGSGMSPEFVAALQAILAAATAVARETGRADGDRADGRCSGGDPDVACTHPNAAPGYRIPGWMRNLIEVRDQDCGFPICRRPVSRCDLDHTVPYDQGGLTCPCNISGGCRHDHRMKGSTAWRLEQPRPGTLIWTSPSGLSWTVQPQPHVA